MSDRQDVERLMKAMNKVIWLFQDHLKTMTALNEVCEHKLTTPLIDVHNDLAKVLKDFRIETNKEIN